MGIGIALMLKTAAAQVPAFPGAEGFGAVAAGGRGGDVYHVTNLGDSGPGTLRDAVQSAAGPRTVVFDVSGTIFLKSTLWVDKPYLTIAGQTAPGDGICIRDYSLCIRRTHDIVVRYLYLRRGDVQVRLTGRPTGSTGLDVISIDDSRNVIIDHCSMSWSCDEIFGIVQNQNVTVQWCLISEPLGDPLVHPYGTEHAYGMNNSATTLSIHHCLMARYVMRGPQFEVNDADSSQGYPVYMESVNNVLFDYKRSGSRYTAGIETDPAAAKGIEFRFHFLNNYYIRQPSLTKTPEIQVTPKWGITDQLRVYVNGNIGPNRLTDDLDPWRSVFVETSNVNIRQASDSLTAQMSDKPLFQSPFPITISSAAQAYEQVLRSAGYDRTRDSIDTRMLNDVRNRKFSSYLKSQQEVGGWVTYSSLRAPLDSDQDGMPDAYEVTAGLNPADAGDRNGDGDADGYTNLEEYLDEESKITDVQRSTPEKFELGLANYPNPFNPVTVIKYSIPHPGRVSLTVVNIAGQIIKTLINGFAPAGSHSHELALPGCASGVYFLQLTFAEQVVCRPIIIAR
jgi:hypothetical protein